MTVRTAELLMGIATLLISLGLMWNVYSADLQIGWVEGRGPGAGMWPFWLSLGMALASFATIVRWFQGKTPESRSLEPYIAQETLFLVIVSAVSLLVLLVLMQRDNALPLVYCNLPAWYRNRLDESEDWPATCTRLLLEPQAGALIPPRAVSYDSLVRHGYSLERLESTSGRYAVTVAFR